MFRALFVIVICWECVSSAVAHPESVINAYAAVRADGVSVRFNMQLEDVCAYADVVPDKEGRLAPAQIAAAVETYGQAIRERFQLFDADGVRIVWDEVEVRHFTVSPHPVPVESLKFTKVSFAMSVAFATAPQVLNWRQQLTQAPNGFVNTLHLRLRQEPAGRRFEQLFESHQELALRLDWTQPSLSEFSIGETAADTAPDRDRRARVIETFGGSQPDEGQRSENSPAPSVEDRPVDVPRSKIGLVLAILMAVSAWGASRWASSRRQRMMVVAAVVVVAAGLRWGTTVFDHESSSANTTGGFPQAEPLIALSDDQQAAIAVKLINEVYQAFDDADRSEESVRVALPGSVDTASIDTVYEAVHVSLREPLHPGVFASVRSVTVDDSQSLALDRINTRLPDAFARYCRWQVIGEVWHAGHNHLRIRKYDAVFVIGRQAGDWVIEQILFF